MYKIISSVPISVKNETYLVIALKIFVFPPTFDEFWTKQIILGRNLQSQISMTCQYQKDLYLQKTRT